MKVYWAKQLPKHWIVEKDNTLYIVPNIAAGWTVRAPYKGHSPTLIEAKPEETRLMLQFIGVNSDVYTT